jgi:hypothetical protein
MDAKEIALYCSEADDFKVDEGEEVMKDQGVALPYYTKRWALP